MLVKPDGLQRGLIGEIVGRFERKGLKLKGIKMVTMTRELLEQWYEQYKDEDFFDDIAKYMSWTPIVAMIWEGYSAIKVVRGITGTRKGYEAEAGSIRGDMGMSGGNNLIHASDAPETAEREIKIMFDKSEIFDYKTVTDALIYSADEIKGIFR